MNVPTLVVRAVNYFCNLSGSLVFCGSAATDRYSESSLDGEQSESIKQLCRGRWLRDEGWLFPLRLHSVNQRIWMNVGRVAFEVCGRRELPRRYLARAINHAEYTHRTPKSSAGINQLDEEMKADVA